MLIMEDRSGFLDLQQVPRKAFQPQRRGDAKEAQWKYRKTAINFLKE